MHVAVAPAEFWCAGGRGSEGALGAAATGREHRGPIDVSASCVGHCICRRQRQVVSGWLSAGIKTPHAPVWCLQRGRFGGIPTMAWSEGSELTGAAGSGWVENAFCSDQRPGSWSVWVRAAPSRSRPGSARCLLALWMCQV